MYINLQHMSQSKGPKIKKVGNHEICSGQLLYLVSLFEGYTVDLAEMLAQELNLEFEIRVVKDGQYGVSDPSIPGGWTGMIGELVRNEADVAISPLTINAQREQVVDFR